VKAINRRVLESLIQAGACDGLGGDRAQLIETVGPTLSRIQDRARSLSPDQVNLFGADQAVEAPDAPLPSVAPWPLAERLRRERDVLGFYFSDHPLAPYRAIAEARATSDSARLRDSRDDTEATLVALVAGIKTISDKKGRPMAFVTVEDFTGSIECLVFADLFEKCRGSIVAGAAIEVRGRVSRRREEEEAKLVVSSVNTIAPPDPAGDPTVHIDLKAGEPSATLEALREILRRHPGASPVYFHVPDEARAATTAIRARRLLVRPSEELIRELKARMGDAAVSVTSGQPQTVPF
jgi:DNA polymerase-3 subunit alpha